MFFVGKESLCMGGIKKMSKTFNEFHSGQVQNIGMVYSSKEWGVWQRHENCADRCILKVIDKNVENGEKLVQNIANLLNEGIIKLED